MNNETYESNPRDYALELVEEGLVSADDMLLNMLKAMSHDDVRWALDANELSPRFDGEGYGKIKGTGGIERGTGGKRKQGETRLVYDRELKQVRVKDQQGNDTGQANISIHE